MKTKFFFLLATLLLTGMCAFAQSGNKGSLKGDVNEDGVVDVADINAIIQIMKDGGGTGEETKYYWYAGQTQPSSISGTPTVDDTNFTVNKWHTLGTATTIGKTITGGTSGNDWYVAVPTSINLKPTAGDLSTPDTSWDNLGTITVNGVSYTVWRPNITGTRCAVYMAQNNTQPDIIDSPNYWYAGQIQPQDMSSNPTVDDTNFTVNKWHTLGTATTIGKTITGGTSGQDWYVAVPTSINLKPTAGDLSTPNTSWDNLGTITVNGVSYTIWRTNSTGGRQAVYMAGTGEETKYYWYVGTTKPTSLSQASTVTSYPAEQTYTNNSGAKSHIFVLTNSNKNVTFIEPNFNSPIDQNEIDTTTISGYKIFETAVGTANTGSIIIRIS